jgi:hypothetical protein
MPGAPAPVDRQFIVWANRFSDAQIEKAFWKTNHKFMNRAVEPELIFRYCTGLLLNLEKESRAAVQAAK